MPQQVLGKVLPARVAEVASDAPLEEALAALAGEDAVVLPTGLVAAHHTVHHAGLVILSTLSIAVPCLGRALVLLPPQVALVPQAIGAPIRVAPSPTHHGHRCVHHQGFFCCFFVVFFPYKILSQH